jgi:hypothetical protein
MTVERVLNKDAATLEPATAAFALRLYYVDALTGIRT